MFDALWMPNYSYRRIFGAGASYAPSAFLIREDAYRHAANLISKYELSLWFEPQWQVASRLARRFPYCTVCSIPEESNLPSLYRVPGWRPRRPQGVL